MSQTEAPSHELYHTGIVVRDIEATMAELTANMGTRWREVGSQVVRTWTAMSGVRDVPFRAVHSLDGPPYLELIESVEGTIWEATGAGSVHHIGYFTDNLSSVAATLESNGAKRIACDLNANDELEFWVYHQTTNGPYVEHVNESLREMIIG